MGVVSPNANGLGGDLFAIVHDNRTDTVHGLNASGWSPAGTSIDFLASIGMNAMPQQGIHSVTVPGAVAGWAARHSRFGRVGFDTLLEPAIGHAEEGFPVSEIEALEWRGCASILASDESAASLYLPKGRPPAAGEIFRNADLARALRAVAREGRDGFYTGEIGARVLECSAERGGRFSRADLAEYDAEWVAPLSTSYRGWDVFEIPPNSQGIAALLMLNILEAFPVGSYGFGTVETIHVMIEAKKLAYADMRRHVGDPKFSQVPIDELLSKAYALERAGLIDPERAAHDVSPGALPAHAGDTTYLCAVDAGGNIASLIQSNFANFGSLVVPPATGFVLQSRGGLFTFDRSHPNALAPRKRPLQTIIPAFMKRDHLRVGFGVMGGWNQPQAHAQVVSNIVDHGFNLQHALEARRSVKLTFDGLDVMMESRCPKELRDALARRGHEIDLQGEFSNMMGGGQAVMRDERSKVNSGASDPRKDGAAIPEPLL